MESQFNYCHLIWMFHSRTLNNKISRIHERALSTVYSDYNSSFNELLDKDGSFTIHQRNVQSLAIEIYKYLHGLSPAILNEVFKVNETIPYDLRMRNELYARNPKTVRYGTETRNYIFFVSKNLVFDTAKYKRLWLLTTFQKQHEKIETQLPMSFMQNIFATCWFHIAQQPILVFFFFLCHLFIFILDIVCKNYSYIIYLEFVLTFKIYRQLTLIGFTLYCSSYVKVNRK